MVFSVLLSYIFGYVLVDAYIFPSEQIREI
jgi:hypothetical protein